jgi:hypothetical protein
LTWLLPWPLRLRFCLQSCVNGGAPLSTGVKHMPTDENSEKMVRLLEEIRDLTKERNEKLEALLQERRKQYEDALQRHKQAQERALAQRRRFLWVLTPLLLLAIGFIAYLAFLVVPSEQRQDRQAEEYRMMIQSNYLSQPH